MGLLAAAAIMPIFPHKTKNPRAREAGFSLLEVMVVLAIMGLMLSVVGARMIGAIESNRFIRTAEAAMADVLLVRSDAMLNSSARSLVTESVTESELDKRGLQTLRRFDVPEGWLVEGDIIEISASGVCSGGYVSIKNPEGRLAVFRLNPPKCNAERVSLQQ